MGPYLFANQYQNEVIPEGMQTFKKHWNRFFHVLPSTLNTFAFVDPAISEADTADYTGIVVVSVDKDQTWYVRLAKRYRLNPTQLIDMFFKIHERFKCHTIGVENVAFQRAIVHFAHEEMKRRGKMIPVTGVNLGTDRTKEMRILSLVPRFEMGSILLTEGLEDLQRELDEFPRGSHDDVLDALSGLESIVHYPIERKIINEPSPQDPNYEKWYIQNVLSRRSGGE